ncbi:DUF72 domain-containing protein [Ramlibacter montanisoli]|uniref:DUF72 domain-containing protein n=1 Tax=Ramlibacter montanisoli TaxID=2732512 RepID=A0A849K5S3_9BURK|nr:DUF72 domain-containing protein [Ramlibacter montanisoli]NNU43738.1 DUF72 domain-containing protein [Ramlibacter montanisoli]
MSDNILVGTASWTDKSLVGCGRFYPPACKTAEQRLRFYASQFPMVEVDSSYYGMPTPQNAQLWAERTPPGFVFNIKAFRLFTGHQTPPETLHRDIQQALGPDLARTLYYADLPLDIRDELWRRFIEALAPLKDAGKLGAVHFQFAPWMLRNRASMAHVEHCVEKMQGHLLAAEFRHATWFSGEHLEQTIDWERSLGLVHTVVDSPQGFANCVPCVWEVTNPRLAILRLHGRNRETWNRKGLAASSARFDYWYSQDELAAMLPEIRHMATLADHVHVIFNTNNEDQGQVGARMMRELLRVNAA